MAAPSPAVSLATYVQLELRSPGMSRINTYAAPLLEASPCAPLTIVSPSIDKEIVLLAEIPSKALRSLKSAYGVKACATELCDMNTNVKMRLNLMTSGLRNDAEECWPRPKTCMRNQLSRNFSKIFIFRVAICPSRRAPEQMYAGSQPSVRVRRRVSSMSSETVPSQRTPIFSRFRGGRRKASRAAKGLCARALWLWKGFRTILPGTTELTTRGYFRLPATFV